MGGFGCSEGGALFKTTLYNHAFMHGLFSLWANDWVLCHVLHSTTM